MRTDFERVYLTAHGPVGVLTLNRPRTLNAISIAMAQDLNRALDHAEQGGAFRALVLTGEGRGFCSGADLAETDRGADAGAALESVYHPLLRRLRDCPLPLVMAVNGPAAGIGMSLALTGDLVLAGRSAYFLQAFNALGLVPDGGSTWLLPRLIGLARARELSLLGDRLPAEKAHAWGLINRVTDDTALMHDAVALAMRLADGPAAQALTRQLLRESPHHTYAQQLDLERQAQARAGRTEDFIEGMQAFAQKRLPHFKGQ
jgi:2-(1,2-epoxy-1,2-dihydrophenyl)acetyl-CoA isomerase